MFGSGGVVIAGSCLHKKTPAYCRGVNSWDTHYGANLRAAKSQQGTITSRYPVIKIY
jgi:hypothetical protein